MLTSVSGSVNRTSASANALRESSSPFQALGRAFLLIFLFLSFSRASDIFIPGLRLPLIFSLLALTMAVFTGGLPRTLSCSVGVMLTAFTGWLIVDVPFSAWPGGSVALLTDLWFKSFLVFVMIAALLRTLKQCRAAMYAIAAATIAVVLMSLAFGGTEMSGRLTLDAGTLSDPNELALAVLSGMPFLMLAAMSADRFSWQRPLAAVAIIGVFFVTSQTGSRMALIAVAALTLVVIVSSSRTNRLKLLAGLAVVLCLGLPFVSTEQRARYLTVFENANTENVTTDGEISAIESAQQREYLFKESIAMTLAHPIFGVGPGAFQIAQAHVSEARGERGVWHETHNVYTQISSEAGVPAFVFFTGALVGSMRLVRRIYEAGRTEDGLSEAGKTAFCLGLSLLVFAVTGCFLSMAYSMYLPTAAGLSVALWNSVQSETAPPAAAPKVAGVARRPFDRIAPGVIRNPSPARV